MVPGGLLLLVPGLQSGLVGIAVIALALLGDMLVRPILLRRKAVTESKMPIEPDRRK